jgi:diguanylate cyclase (GGDEF)-like protein/PAS domain S-box-containing protein
MAEPGGSSRARRVFLVFTASVLAVVVGTVGSFQLLGIAASRARATVLVGQVQVHAPVLLGLVFAAVNSPGQGLANDAVTGDRIQITSELGQLRTIGAEGEDVAALSASVQKFFTAIDLVGSKLRAGDRAGADVVANQQLVPASAALTAENGKALGELGRASEAASSQARVGVLGLLIGTVATVVGLLVVGDRRRRRERDAASAHFESLVQSSSDVILVTGADGVPTYASPSLGQTLGYPAVELDMRRRIHPDDLPVVEAAIEAVRSTPDGSARLEFRVMHHDGRWLTVESTITNKLADTGVGGFVWNARDISDRKALEDQLLRQALEDPLTGLANRIVLRDRLSRALARAARNNRSVGVLLFDLDGFKEINDAAGHEAGDAVLIEVAARLSSCLRSVDTVARLGGDEFAMVIDDLADDGILGEVAARALAVMQEPVAVGTRQFRISASVGKVMCLGDHDPEEALRNADIAMYAAKAGGKARMVTFEPVMADQVQERLALAHDLEGAAASGRLVIHYQPTVDLETGIIQGTEALVRWDHPTRGYLPPLAFIPLAEETGAILSIGRWVLNAACRQAALWQHDPAMAAVRSVSVNVSGVQLLDDNIVGDVRDALGAAGLAPERLTLEITESVLMQDAEAVLVQLTALKALGVSLAIDDFGTGYSSLSYLRRFPVDILKIDKSFVDSVAHHGTALVKAIVNMGASLQMTTVAEGIEDEGQAATLEELGCDVGQGFLFARPLPADQFEAAVKSREQHLLAVPGR